MNRDEIMIMQPGPEMDLAIVKMLEWDHYVNSKGEVNARKDFLESGFVFKPSILITDAWEVVEKMRTTHKQYITIIDNPHLNYDVRFSGNKSSEYERLSSLPHAICRAALLSLIQEDTP